MKVLVTGAGGFLGAKVVEAAAQAGHMVYGLYRPASLPDASRLAAGVCVVAGDLRQTGDWAAALGDIEAVVHCAAAASGDIATQLAGTVVATENLLAALPNDLVRFVHVSSLSVYDFAAPGWGARLDETTALEPDPARRDAYTVTKMQQEQMVRAYCQAHATNLTVVRPGAIWGPGKDWDFGRALRVGPFDLVFAPLSPMRLVHVDDCAAAIVAAIVSPHAGEAVFNLVCDEQPGHWRFHRLARRAGAPVGLGIPVPYWVVRGLGLMARMASRWFFSGRARLPELLDTPRQRVRWRGLRYGNAKAKQGLSWRPTIDLRTGLADLVAKSRRLGRDTT